MSIQKTTKVLILLFFLVLPFNSQLASDITVEQAISGFQLQNFELKVNESYVVKINGIRKIKDQGFSLFLTSDSDFLDVALFPKNKPQSKCGKSSKIDSIISIINFDFDDCSENSDEYHVSIKVNSDAPFSSNKINVDLIISKNNYFSSNFQSDEFIKNGNFMKGLENWKGGLINSITKGNKSNKYLHETKNVYNLDISSLSISEISQDFQVDTVKDCVLSIGYSANSFFSLENSGLRVIINETPLVDFQKSLNDSPIKGVFKFQSKQGSNTLKISGNKIKTQLGMNIFDVSVKCEKSQKNSLNLSIQPTTSSYIYLKNTKYDVDLYLSQIIDSSTKRMKLSYIELPVFSFKSIEDSQTSFTEIIDSASIKSNPKPTSYIIKVENVDENIIQNGLLYISSSNLYVPTNLSIGDSELISVSGTFSFKLNDKINKVIRIENVAGSSGTVKINNANVNLTEKVYEAETLSDDLIQITTEDGKTGLFIISVKVALKSFTKQGEMSIWMNKKETYVFFELKDINQLTKGISKDFSFSRQDPVLFISQSIILTNSKTDPSSILLPFDDVNNSINSNIEKSSYRNTYSLSSYADEDSQAYVVFRIKYEGVDNVNNYKLELNNCILVQANRNKIFYLDTDVNKCITIPYSSSDIYTGLSLNLITSSTAFIENKKVIISSDELVISNVSFSNNYNVKVNKNRVEAMFDEGRRLTLRFNSKYIGEIQVSGFYYNVANEESEFNYDGVNSTLNLDSEETRTMSINWEPANKFNQDSYNIVYYIGMYESSTVPENPTFLDLVKLGFMGNSIGNRSFISKVPLRIPFSVFLFMSDLRTGEIKMYLPLKNLKDAIPFASKLELIDEPKGIVVDFKSNDETKANINIEYLAIDVSKLNNSIFIVESLSNLDIKTGFTNKEIGKLKKTDFESLKSLSETSIQIRKENDLQTFFIVSIDKKNSVTDLLFNVVVKRPPTPIKLENIYKISYNEEKYVDIEVPSSDLPKDFRYYLVCLNCSIKKSLQVALSFDGEIPYLDSKENWNRYDSLIMDQRELTDLNIDNQLKADRLKFSIRRNDESITSPFYIKLVKRSYRMFYFDQARNDFKLSYSLKASQKTVALVRIRNEFCVANSVINGNSSFKIHLKHSLYHLLNIDSPLFSSNQSYSKLKCFGQVGRVSVFIVEVFSDSDSLGEVSITQISNQETSNDKSNISGGDIVLPDGSGSKGGSGDNNQTPSNTNEYLIRVLPNQTVNIKEIIQNNSNLVNNPEKSRIVIAPISSESNVNTKVIINKGNEREKESSSNTPVTIDPIKDAFKNNTLTVSNDNQKEVIVRILIVKPIDDPSKLIIPTDKTSEIKIDGQPNVELTIKKIVVLDPPTKDNLKILTKVIITSKNNSTITKVSYLYTENQSPNNNTLLYDNPLGYTSISYNSLYNKVVELQIPRSLEFSKQIFLIIEIRVFLKDSQAIIELQPVFSNISLEELNNKSKINIVLTYNDALVSFKVGNVDLTPSADDLLKKFPSRFDTQFEQVLKDGDVIQIVVKNTFTIPDSYFAMLYMNITHPDGNKQVIYTNLADWECNGDVPTLGVSSKMDLAELNWVPKIWASSSLPQVNCYTNFKKETFKQNEFIEGEVLVNDVFESIKIGSYIFNPSLNKSNIANTTSNVEEVKFDMIVPINTFYKIKDGDVIEIVGTDSPNSTGKGIRAWISLFNIFNEKVIIVTDLLNWKCNGKPAVRSDADENIKLQNNNLISNIWSIDDVNKVGSKVTCQYVYREQTQRKTKVKISIRGNDFIENLQIGSSYQYIPAYTDNRVITFVDYINIKEDDTFIITARSKDINNPSSGLSIEARFEFVDNSKKLIVIETDTDWSCDGKPAVAIRNSLPAAQVFSNTTPIWAEKNKGFTVCSKKFVKKELCFLK